MAEPKTELHSDICTCEHFRSDHTKGTGECRECDSECKEFTFMRAANPTELSHWTKYHQLQFTSTRIQDDRCAADLNSIDKETQNVSEENQD